jgi:uncharacterized protein (TIGR02300 family)
MQMPKDEWGVKRVCPNCQTRFYDLQRDPMVCPSCGHSFDVASLTGPRSRMIAPEKVAKPKPGPVRDDLDDDATVLDDEDDDSVDLGDEVLEDDDDTVDLDDLTDVAADDDET